MIDLKRDTVARSTLRHALGMGRLRRQLLLLAIGITFAPIAATDDLIETRTWVVGEFGASLYLEGRISIIIPRGAVSEETTLTVSIEPLPEILRKPPMSRVVVGDYLAAFSPMLIFNKPIEIRFHYKDTDLKTGQHESGFSIGRQAPILGWAMENSNLGEHVSESGPGGEHNVEENWMSLYTDYWEGRRIIFAGGS